MKFSRTQSSIVLSILIIIFIFIFIGTKYLSDTIFSLTTVFLVSFLVYLATTFYKITEGKLIKYTLFSKSFEIEIESIKYIEAITVRKVGVVYITIKSDPEDFYYLHLKDNSKIKIDSHYRNSRKSIGRYLSKKFRIQFKETEKVKYFH